MKKTSRAIVGCLASIAIATLTACGGGGSSETPCSSSGFAITTSWTVTGGSYNPATYLDQIVVGTKGVALSAKPVHTGIPSGCVGKGVYLLGNSAYPLPAGLSLNPSTGEISGTATATGDVTGGGTNTGVVRLAFPGFASAKALVRLAIF